MAALNFKSDGSVPIKSGTPGSGKVLTSDANGFATWQSASAPGLGASWGQTLYLTFVYLGGGTVWFNQAVLGTGASGVNVFTINGYDPPNAITYDAMLLSINGNNFNDTFACSSRRNTFSGVTSFDVNVYRVA